MAQENEKIRVLLIEDNPGDARLIREMLKETDGVSFDLEWEDTLGKGLKKLSTGNFNVILLDLALPDSHGFMTLSKTQAEAPLMPIVIMTGLDDETVAIGAVRKGAQDYLVKGRVTSDSLVRSIRYAIARKSGAGKSFTLSELKSFDGKEGRAGYIAYEGKIFDVSDSRLWMSGVHAGRHFPGNDLTEALRAAPHGEEALARLPVIGDLVREETLSHRLLLKMEGLHPHPISVHFAIAYSIGVSLFSFLFLFTGNILFETASYYLLCLCFLASPFAGLTGLLSWQISYEGKMTAILRRKMIFTVLLVFAVTTAFVWRTANPDILSEETAMRYLYLTLVLSLTPIVVVLGHAGGKIVHP